jgi:hypothetical protein
MRRPRSLLAAMLATAACSLLAAPAAAAPPTINYSVAGTAGDGGWYRSAITVSWAVSFNGLPALATSGCEPAVRLTRDTPGTTLTCRASNADGETIARTRLMRIDQTPPSIAPGVAARAPDGNGWYRAPVAIAWSGADALSGIAGCTALTYAGPDGSAAPFGVCRDRAGNVSAAAPFALRYDTTPPALSAVSAAGGDTVATVRWRASGDAAAVTVTRSPGVRGEAASIVYEGRANRFEETGLRNRVRYVYTVTATDAAGNSTSATDPARTVSRLRAPRPGARLTRPPLLRWKRVSGARYYNVQLSRGTQKVLSAWPRRPRLRLHSAWRYGGERRRLAPATYRWYVWPGYGRRSERRYGTLLGTRRFAVVAPAR